MLVLDTDVVTLLQYPDAERARRLAAVTITTFEEQVRGRLADCARAKTPEAYARATDGLARLLRDYQNRAVLPFDDRAAAEFRRLKGLKVRVGTMDLRIASVALAHGATLVTMNLRDYAPVPSLRAEDWTTG